MNVRLFTELTKEFVKNASLPIFSGLALSGKGVVRQLTEGRGVFLSCR